MGCFLGCLAVVLPRLALALVWLFGPSGYLTRPFPGAIWVLLGFLFLPTTTLAFAYATNSIAPTGGLSPFGWLLVALGLLVDLGFLGGGRRAARWHRRRGD